MTTSSTFSALIVTRRLQSRRGSGRSDTAVVALADDHPDAARRAPEHPEPGEQPVGLGLRARAARGPLDGLPELAVDDRLVRVQVRLEVAEVDLPEHDPGGEQRPDAVVASA